MNTADRRDCILIIEDEPTLVLGLRDAFEHNGLAVLSAGDGDLGLQLALSGQADLIVLDLMLPGRDGLQICRELRKRRIHTPILMLTAKGGEMDRVTGLEIGADDYVTKPFSVLELVARAKALLRRAGLAPDLPSRIQVGVAEVDFKEYVAIRDGEAQPLTRLEVALLRLFVSHPREVITRDRLLTEVWGFDAMPTTRTIDTFMLRLRQKTERDPRRPVHFLTVHGAGYKYVPAEKV